LHVFDKTLRKIIKNCNQHFQTQLKLST